MPTQGLFVVIPVWGPRAFTYLDPSCDSLFPVLFTCSSKHVEFIPFGVGLNSSTWGAHGPYLRCLFHAVNVVTQKSKHVFFTMLLVLWRQRSGCCLFVGELAKICYQLPRIESTCAGFRDSGISSD